MAFLLMALSFFMHQRSNEEVIGTLQSSVSTLQELQESQDKIMRLQSQLTDANKQIETLQSQLDELNSAQSTGSDKTAALLALYTLQQEFSAKDSNACKPVSYTHLDVYKRQLSGLLAGTLARKVLSSGFLSACLLYTSRCV